MKPPRDYFVSYDCGCRCVFLGAAHYLSARIESCPKHQRAKFRKRREAMYLHAYDRMRSAVQHVAEAN